MLTIVAAMEHELVGLRRELPLRQAKAGNGPSRPGLELQVIGMGRKRAQSRIRALLEDRDRSLESRDNLPHWLLLLGFGGAVDPALHPGDLSVPTRYYLDHREGGDGDFLKPDDGMRRLAVASVAEAGRPVANLDSLTVEHLAADPEAKKALRQRYQVGMVDMEDYWVAQVAAEAGVPFLSVRSVLDSAHQTLPSYLLGLAEHRGKAVFTTVAMPWRIPTLWRLARQMRQPQHSLTRFALSFISRFLLSCPEVGPADAAPEGLPVEEKAG